MNGWRNVLELDHDLSAGGGSAAELQNAIRRGTDLRIYTEFRHNEHVEPGSANAELVQEVSEFRRLIQHLASMKLA